MSDGRKRLSGSDYRKRSKEKNEKEQEVIKRSKKINSFFMSKSIDNTINTTNTSNQIIVDSDSSFVENIKIIDNGLNNKPPETENIKSIDDSLNNKPSEIENIKIIDDSENILLSNNNNTSTLSKTTFCVPKDPIDWIINNTTCDYIVMHGFNQNKNLNFLNSKRQYNDVNRYLTISLFERKLLNGEKCLQTWLVYSEKKGCVFCGPCILFDRDNYSQFSKDGFNDWKNAESRVRQHENSTKHTSNLITLKERANKLGTINVSLTKQLIIGKMC